MMPTGLRLAPCPSALSALLFEAGWPNLIRMDDDDDIVYNHDEDEWDDIDEVLVDNSSGTRSSQATSAIVKNNMKKS